MEKPIDIILDIPKNTRVQRIRLDNNGTHVDCSIDGVLKIKPGHLYYVPISEKKLSFSDGVYIQKSQDVAHLISVHSVEDGHAIIEPILHCSLSHNSKIAILH
jgi:hypothetical protein